MRKITYAVLIMVVIGLASCSSYTCPTYSKAKDLGTSGETKI